MIPYLGCEAARGMLEASLDGELGMNDQVVLDAHLRWCDTCRARLSDLRTIGDMLRLGAAALDPAPGQAMPLAAMRDGVLTRVRAEHDESLPVRCREALTDMRYLWPAIGATLAVLACVCAITAVNRIVRAEHPGSMAELISALATPGSNRNPLDLDSAILAPRPVNPPALFIPADEAEFAVSAVVTREGRVSNSTLLRSVREQIVRSPGSAMSDEVMALLALVERSRFEPAQARGDRVAVNVVWLLARTTVKPAKADRPPVRVPAADPVSGALEEPVLRPARS